MIAIAKTQVAMNFYRQMHKRILLGKFKNNKLPAVRQLAEDAGLSVPSVMEGINLLEARKVVWCRQGSGVYVSDLKTRPLEIVVLQADYPSNRFEMLNAAVEQLSLQKNYRYERRLIPLWTTDTAELPDFADVIIYLAPSHGLRPAWLAEIEARCGIMVLMDKEPGNLVIDSIATDSEAMVTQALKFLHDRGHHHIWYIHNSPPIFDVIIRYFAAARWAVDHNIRLEHIDCQISSGDDGYGKAREKILFRLQQSDVKPTAMLAINQAGSLAAYHACTAAGLSVPNDISIIGLNDAPEVRAADITVIAEQQSDFTRALDRMIRLRIFEKCGQVLNINVSGNLIERSSVSKI